MSASRTAFLAIVLLISGCSLSGPLSPGDRRDLREAKEKWAAKGSANYTVEARISCFCSSHLAYWTTVTVRNGVVTNAQPLAPLPEYTEASTFGWVTVPELFDLITDAGGYVKRIDVMFDPTLGYPREVKVTCDSNVADCGSVHGMRNLVVQ